MTIIAVHNDIMGADSMSFSEGMMKPFPRDVSKIARAPDGSLVGGTGHSLDTHALREWVVAGMDFAKPPKFLNHTDNTDCIMWVWLRHDAKCFSGNETMMFHEVSTPYAIGYQTATTLWLGAILAGASMEQAIRIAIERCVWVGGEPHLQQLPMKLTVSKQLPRISTCAIW